MCDHATLISDYLKVNGLVLLTGLLITPRCVSMLDSSQQWNGRKLLNELMYVSAFEKSKPARDTGIES